MVNFAYEFGRAVAHFKGQEFQMNEFVSLCASSAVGLTYAVGSNGLRDAMIGAFDEYKRVADLYDGRKVKES